MSSKEQKPSKKAQKEKQKKAIEESTFGLKNKNKSKKVQQFITRVEKSVKNSGGGLEKEKAKELKKEQKLVKMMQEEELRKLFNEAIGNQYGVKKTKAQANAAQLGLTSAKKEVVDFLDAISSDESDDDFSDDEDELGIETSLGADENMADVQGGIEVYREKTIEDVIEEQRAKLLAEGKKGTPVTAESFAKWRAEKTARKQADAEARLKIEQSKKKGGKGLSVLSGKELFNYNAALFVDDESAFDTSNDKTINAEMKALQEKEEQQIREEYERAQAEQQRLAEIQVAEIQARTYKEEEKRLKALDANHITFVFNGIVVNQIVFEEDDYEDLELFPDEQFLPNYELTVSDIQQKEMDSLMKEFNLHDIHERLRMIEAQLNQDTEEEDEYENEEEDADDNIDKDDAVDEEEHLDED